MKSRYKYLFGPVPSRRLGLSLGVDLIPLKTCTQNCVYCQLGIDGAVTVERKEYVSADEVIAELRDFAGSGVRADYITFSGSGEPTLHSRIGYIIEETRKITDISIAIITNGSLFADEDIRRDCAKADVVLPSLDAPDAETFRRINRPHKNINFDNFVEGLCKFRTEFAGQVWLEIFLVDNFNTSKEHIEKFRDIISRISPDKVHLNTAVRPVVVKEVCAVEQERLKAIAKRLDCGAEVVAGFNRLNLHRLTEINEHTILEMLRRRPCSKADISSSLGADAGAVQDVLKKLIEGRLVVVEYRAGKTYYKIA